MKLKVNWDNKRCKHALEKMFLRGISRNDVRSAIIKGAKIRQKTTRLTESIYRYFSVVYDEVPFKKKEMRKVYPVTVKIRG